MKPLCYYFAIIFLAGAIVFFPSFTHMFRSDQIMYFANTRGHTELLDVWKHYYAYEHVRYYGPGDGFLFRPVMSLLLGFEKVAFGTHYAAWHVTGFAFHMLAVWYLLRILLLLNGGIAAFLAALLFSCSFALTEAVVWEHINGYVLFNGIVLSALYYFLRHFNPGGKLIHVWAAVLLLTLAAFTHEFGAVFAVLFGICYSWNSRQQRPQARDARVLLFVMPLVLYAAASLSVGAGERGPAASQAFHQVQGVFSWGNCLRVAAFLPTYVWQFTQYFLFPAGFEAQMSMFDRLLLLPKDLDAGAALNAVAFCGLGWVLVHAVGAGALRAGRPSFVVLMAGMICAVMVLVPLVRLPTHGEDYILFAGTYYTHIVLAYILVLVFMIIDWRTFYGGVSPAVKMVAAASLAVFVGLNACQTWTANRMVAETQAPFRNYVDVLNAFVRSHAGESGFSFVVRQDGEFRAPHFTPEGDLVEERLGLASVLYYPYYNPRTPRYHFRLSRDQSSLDLQP